MSGDYLDKRLSIIIPTYLEEKTLGYLLAKLDSSLKEEYRFEIIVSDGGSTDGTIDIASRFADIVVQHTLPTKQNIAQGRNAGAKVANTEILIFLNSDCLPHDIPFFFDFITKWSTDFSIGNKTNIDAIACKVKAMPDDKKSRDSFFYFILNKYFHFLNVIGIGMGRGECQIVRRDLFNKVGGYNSVLAAGEDFDLYRRIKKSGASIYFSNELEIYESPRRFRKYGYIKTL